MYMYIGTMTDISKVADQYTSAQQATSVEQGKKGPDILDGDYARTDPDDYAVALRMFRSMGRSAPNPKGPGQSMCNWPFPDWARNRHERIAKFLTGSTMRRRLDLIHTVDPSEVHTWRWAGVDGPRGRLYGLGPLYEPQPMPQELVDLVNSIPDHAFVSWELTPWVQYRGAAKKTDYFPTTRQIESGKGWDATTYAEGPSFPRHDDLYPEDMKRMDVGKFVSGGAKVYCCTSREEWLRKRGSGGDKDSWEGASASAEYTSRVKAYTAQRDDMPNAFFMRKDATDRGYRDAFEPVCGFMQLRYQDAFFSKSSANKKNVMRSQMAMFHPHSWMPEGDRNAVPAIRRLWWKWPGNGNLPGQSRAQGQMSIMDLRHELQGALDDNFANGKKIVPTDGLIRGEHADAARFANNSGGTDLGVKDTVKYSARSMTSYGEAGEIIFGTKGEGIEVLQQHLDILNPGYRFLQNGGAWTVEAGTSASSLNGTMMGNVLKWAASAL